MTTALALSGLPTDAFLFAGFLPTRSAARRARIAELQTIAATLVFFEAPPRLAESLADLAETLGLRDAVVARELTKLHEEAKRGTLAELAAWAASHTPRGEIVILVAPGTHVEVTDAEIEAKLALLLDAMSLRDAAKVAAETLGVAKARAYDLALALKRTRDG
jgi:16S rRNA (cytidine1402-2'-O)-methyltransferase